MTLNEFIADIVAFCQEETERIIAELERLRFSNQGAFNGNPRWYDNHPEVIKDKGRNQPLVDSGNLRRELENPKNWDLKPNFNKNLLTLTIPETENFTDSKYNVLQTGGAVSPYVSRRGNKINIHSVGPRQFKNFTAQDIDWIQDKLVKAIEDKYT
jgi:hypothetical protein